MTSILTNAAAMAALQTLRFLDSSLATTQAHVSSGLRVQGARDNAAYSFRNRRRQRSVTARLLPWGICLDTRDNLFVEDEAIEELLPFFGRPTRVAQHLPEFVNAICPSSNDLRLFGLWKNGVSGSVCWLI